MTFKFLRFCFFFPTKSWKTLHQKLLIISPIFLLFFTFFLCNFSVRTLQCFQFFFFAHKKLKKPPSKVAHNRPKPFIPQPSPTHRQQPKIDFSYHKNVPPSVCSLVCGRDSLIGSILYALPVLSEVPFKITSYSRIHLPLVNVAFKLNNLVCTLEKSEFTFYFI